MTVTNVARSTKVNLGHHTGTTLRLLVTLVDATGTVKDATTADEARFVMRLEEGDIVKTLAGGGITIDTSNADGKGRLLVTIIPANTVGIQGQNGQHELSVSFGIDRATVLWGKVILTKSISEPDVEFSLAELSVGDDTEFTIEEAA